MTVIVTPLPSIVSPATASAGPAMYASSTSIESSANALRRWETGTIATRHCLVTLNTGNASSPATAAVPIRAGNGSAHAHAQNTACATVVTMTTGRKPCLSTNLPDNGEPIAMPMVLAMVTSPALPYPRSSATATCRVSVIPMAVDGTRASSPISSNAGTPGILSSRR
jgi:hypothetical protein